MPIAFIAIGSNLGNRIENCDKALREISDFAEISAVSSIYETEPVGKEDQPDFINCAAKIETDLSASQLLLSLQSVESKFGRERVRRWGPRTVDLDIIFYDDLAIETEELVIPHPAAHLRRFVLEPVCEIAPDFVHPVLKVSVSTLLSNLQSDKTVTKIGRFST